MKDYYQKDYHNNKCADCESCLDYIKTKNEKVILKCFNCKSYYEKEFNKELIERFAGTYEFCNKDLNKFILLLRKVFILTNIWIIGKDLAKHHYPIKNLFVVTYTWKILMILIIGMVIT